MKLHRMRAPPVPLLSHPSYAQVTSSALDFQDFSLRSSFSVRDQVSHPHNRTGKIIFPYILIFRGAR